MSPAVPHYQTEPAPLQLHQPTRALWLAAIETVALDLRLPCASPGCHTCDRADAIAAAHDEELQGIAEILGLRSVLLFAARQTSCCDRASRPESDPAPQRRAA